MNGLKLFGGVEGGATHSNLVICDEKGKVISRSKGLGTNHWNLGIDECAKRIIQMLHAAKTEAGISLDTPLDSLGLTLSGCEQDSSNADLARQVKEIDEDSAKAIYVASDTAGSLFTGAPNGGMVLIAGTGSNALLRTPDGQQFGCGGWGYILGDEGSAYWIAHRAIKIIFDDCDGLLPAPHSTTKLWETIRRYFKADTRSDLLPHVYKHFEKSFFAGLTAELSTLADEGDALSQHIFADAGAALASHVTALATRSQNGTRPFVNGLRIVCVGSVWKSWDALSPGALSVLNARRLNIDLELVRLRVSSAMGAAWLAAKHVQFDLPRDDSAFCEVFYNYHPDNGKMNGDGGNKGCGCNEFWS